MLIPRRCSTKGMEPDIFSSVFNTRMKLNYNQHHVSHFDVLLRKSIYNLTESISFWDSKFGICYQMKLKKKGTVEAFDSARRNGNLEIAHVHFCKSYQVTGVGFIWYTLSKADLTFNFHFYKESIVYLCFCFSIDSTRNS